jgi:hypothetical protein
MRWLPHTTGCTVRWLSFTARLLSSRASAACSRDGTVREWDPAAGKALAKLDVGGGLGGPCGAVAATEQTGTRSGVCAGGVRG